MKKIIQINFLIFPIITLFAMSSYGQQKPSERSFTTVMNEVKQKQAARAKMLQQIRQTTSQSQNVQGQPVNTNTGAATILRSGQPAQKASVQPPNSKAVIQQSKFPTKPKKE